jgi:ABC-2 type transport system ATP-binding protein
VRVAGDPAVLLALAHGLPFVHDAAVVDGALSIGLDDPDTQNPALVAALVAAGAQIRYVEPRTHSLEDVYLELVGNEKP